MLNFINISNSIYSMGNQKKKKSNDVVIDVELFSELVIQVGTLKEIYDKIAINKDMNVFQKKVLLKNKEKNLDILKQLEIICENI